MQNATSKPKLVIIGPKRDWLSDLAKYDAQRGNKHAAAVLKWLPKQKS